MSRSLATLAALALTAIPALAHPGHCSTRAMAMSIGTSF
jgi:hypothetical protein